MTTLKYEGMLISAGKLRYLIVRKSSQSSRYKVITMRTSSIRIISIVYTESEIFNQFREGKWKPLMHLPQVIEEALDD